MKKIWECYSTPLPFELWNGNMATQQKGSILKTCFWFTLNSLSYSCFVDLLCHSVLFSTGHERRLWGALIIHFSLVSPWRSQGCKCEWELEPCSYLCSLRSSPALPTEGNVFHLPFQINKPAWQTWEFRALGSNQNYFL